MSLPIRQVLTLNNAFSFKTYLSMLSRSTRWLLIIFAIISAFSFQCMAQATPKRLLLALSKTEHILAILDPVTLQVLARVPVGEDPHEVIASADGKTAYVSNTGFGALHEINVIDLTTQKPLNNIDTRPLFGPHGLAFAGGKIWFTAQGSKAVGRYDVQAGALDWSMGTGQNTTHLLYVSPDEKRIYTTNVGSGTVSLFQNEFVQPAIPPTGKLPPNAKPRMDWLQTVIPVGAGSEGFDVSPDEKELWTVKPDGTIAIINLETKTLSDSVNTHVLGLHRIKFTPDGQRVIMVSVRAGDLLVYDVKKRREIKRLNIGQGAGIMIDAESNRAFISCTPNDYIAVFDLKTLEVTSHLNVGGRPDGMAIVIQQ